MCLRREARERDSMARATVWCARCATAWGSRSPTPRRSVVCTACSTQRWWAARTASRARHRRRAAARLIRHRARLTPRPSPTHSARALLQASDCHSSPRRRPCRPPLPPPCPPSRPSLTHSPTIPLPATPRHLPCPPPCPSPPPTATTHAYTPHMINTPRSTALTTWRPGSATWTWSCGAWATPGKSGHSGWRVSRL
jgi:hypothetical protein